MTVPNPLSGRLTGIPVRLALLAVGILLASSSSASAQFGFGFGYGMGMGMGPNSQQTAQQVNKMSQIAASSAYAARGGPGGRGITPYANNPGAYVNIGRDRRFQEMDQLRAQQLSVTSRAPVSESSLTRFQPFTRPATTPAAASSALALASFFSQAGIVSWPADAPAEGDLKAKRELSDQLSLAVLQEYNTEGLARVSTVTQARDVLIEYGRPALQYLRTNNSQALSDSFHSFLLGLYNAIGEAAKVPNPQIKTP